MVKSIKHYILIFHQQIKSLEKNKKLNTDVWYDEEFFKLDQSFF